MKSDFIKRLNAISFNVFSSLNSHLNRKNPITVKIKIFKSNLKKKLFHSSSKKMFKISFKTNLKNFKLFLKVIKDCNLANIFTFEQYQVVVVRTSNYKTKDFILTIYLQIFSELGSTRNKSHSTFRQLNLQFVAYFFLDKILFHLD